MFALFGKTSGLLARLWLVQFTTATITAALALGTVAAARIMFTVFRLLRGSAGVGQPNIRTRLLCLPWLVPLLCARMFNSASMLWTRLLTRRVSSRGVDDAQFDGLLHFTKHIQRLEAAGPRYTGSDAHGAYVKWLKDELETLPGLQVDSIPAPLYGWLPGDGLEQSATLTLAKHHTDHVMIPVAGAVPYSLPTTGNGGQLVHVPRHRKICGDELKGKMVLRDFPTRQVPYALGILPAYLTTRDLDDDLLSFYDRPGFADEFIHNDLLDAGTAQVAGVLFMFDVPREQVASYFEPHKGTHYEVPAAYLGHDEATTLLAAASNTATSPSATLKISASATEATAHALTATLPGQISERILYVTHTDGNTCVQENGAVALLSLARYFATHPLSSRRRTIQFVFNVGHLHISREGCLAQARALDSVFDDDSDGPVTLVIPVEHLGTREIEAVLVAHDNTQPDKHSEPTGKKGGRCLRYTGRNETMFWCVGPSPPVIRAVTDAVIRRGLDRVVVTRGVSRPRFDKIPHYSSFGGIGGYYHNALLPTTSLISGPWSLWAPGFGAEAVDVARLRQQTLALGDIYVSLETVERADIIGGYEEYRRERGLPGRSWKFQVPKERAADIQRKSGGDLVQY